MPMEKFWNRQWSVLRTLTRYVPPTEAVGISPEGFYPRAGLYRKQAVIRYWKDCAYVRQVPVFFHSRPSDVVEQQ